MRIEAEVKLDYKDVMMRPKRSTLNSRKEVDISREFTFLNSKQKWKGIPIMASNMDTIGTMEIAKTLYSHQLFTCLHKYYTVEELAAVKDEDFMQNCAITVGIKEHDELFLKDLKKEFTPKFLCIDVANGYTERFISFVRETREMFPNTTIIAGNVVTGEMTEEILLSGADIVKVGIGPGSVCTTRLKSGVGYPQLSAVIECSDAAHGLGGRIIADGGCTSPGDVAKAFGGGADFVMLGGMFAGHEENPGEIVEQDGKQYKIFYGMSSATAMQKYHGGVANYRAAEGKTVSVEYRGPLSATVEDILGGVRSCCTYIGARTLKDVSKCTTFIRCSQLANEVFSSN